MNIKLASIALSGALLISGASFAADCDPTFYVGGDLQANQYQGLSKTVTDKNGFTAPRTDRKPILSKRGGGAGLFAGARFMENLGLEAGYSVFGKQTTNLTGNTVGVFNGLPVNNFKGKVVARHRNAYFDVMGYLPVSNEVDLLGSIGVGRLTSKQTVNSTYLFNNTVQNQTSLTTRSSKTGLRVGAGAQVKLTDNIGARFMVNHQKGNKIIKNVNSAHVGMFYQF